MLVTLLQVLYGTQWVVVGVYADKALAEAEATRAGYVKWSTAEFGVIGGNNA